MISEKEIYKRAYDDLLREHNNAIILCREYPKSENALQYEQTLFDKIIELNQLRFRKGYL